MRKQRLNQIALPLILASVKHWLLLQRQHPNFLEITHSSQSLQLVKRRQDRSRRQILLFNLQPYPRTQLGVCILSLAIPIIDTNALNIPGFNRAGINVTVVQRLKNTVDVFVLRIEQHLRHHQRRMQIHATQRRRRSEDRGVLFRNQATFDQTLYQVTHRTRLCLRQGPLRILRALMCKPSSCIRLELLQPPHHHVINHQQRRPLISNRHQTHLLRESLQQPIPQKLIRIRNIAALHSLLKLTQNLRHRQMLRALREMRAQQLANLSRHCTNSSLRTIPHNRHTRTIRRPQVREHLQLEPALANLVMPLPINQGITNPDRHERVVIPEMLRLSPQRVTIKVAANTLQQRIREHDRIVHTIHRQRSIGLQTQRLERRSILQRISHYDEASRTLHSPRLRLRQSCAREILASVRITQKTIHLANLSPEILQQLLLTNGILLDLNRIPQRTGPPRRASHILQQLQSLRLIRLRLSRISRRAPPSLRLRLRRIPSHRMLKQRPQLIQRNLSHIIVSLRIVLRQRHQRSVHIWGKLPRLLRL